MALSTARAGRGVVVAVSGDTRQLRGALDNAHRDLAALEKGKAVKIEGKVQWDFAEHHAQREARRIVNNIEREIGKARAVGIVDQMGLGGIGRQLGVVKGPERPAVSLIDKVENTMAGLRASRAMMVTDMVGQAAHAVGRGSAAFGLMGSRDPMLKAQGGIDAIDATKALPIIGQLAGAFDELIGATRNLRFSMHATAVREQQVIRSAQMTGNPVEIARAENKAERVELDRKHQAATTGFGPRVMSFLHKYNPLYRAGLFGKNPVAGAHSQYAAARAALDPNQKQAEDIAEAERANQLDAIANEGALADMSVARTPWAAREFQLESGLKAEMRVIRATKDAPRIKAVEDAQAKRRAAFKAERDREQRVVELNDAFAITSAQMRTANRGGEAAGVNDMLGDFALARINAPNEFKARERLTVRQTAEARAKFTAMSIGSGGTAQAASVLSVAGDPFDPANKDREHAVGMLRDFLSQPGRGGVTDLRKPVGILDRGALGGIGMAMRVAGDASGVRSTTLGAAAGERNDDRVVNLLQQAVTALSKLAGTPLLGSVPMGLKDQWFPNAR